MTFYEFTHQTNRKSDAPFLDKADALCRDYLIKLYKYKFEILDLITFPVYYRLEIQFYTIHFPHIIRFLRLDN